jgi:hypothetical protein
MTIGPRHRREGHPNRKVGRERFTGYMPPFESEDIRDSGALRSAVRWDEDPEGNESWRGKKWLDSDD